MEIFSCGRAGTELFVILGQRIYYYREDGGCDFRPAPHGRTQNCMPGNSFIFPTPADQVIDS